MLAETRRTIRWGVRSAARIGKGAHGLGAGAVASWAIARIRGVDDASGESTSFTWVVADDETTTRVWIHNYWSDAYGIPRPRIDATLLDTEGRSIDAWTFVLEPDSTVVVDVRDRCHRADRQLPFEGQLLLGLHEPTLPAGRPLQVFAEYERDDGESSGVHGQYGIMRAPVGQVLSTMRVEAGPDRRTGVIVVNPYDGPGGAKPMRVDLEILNAQGAVRSVTLDTLGPRAMRRVYLDEAVPGLAGFLGGEAGNARVSVPCPMSRIANFLEFGDDAGWVVNHGTIDRTFQQDAGIGHEWCASDPVASAMVLTAGERETVLTLQNVWGPVPADYAAEVAVFDPAGVELLRHTVRVRENGVAQVRSGELFRDYGLDPPPVAHAEIRVRPVGGHEAPATFDVLVGILDRDRLVGEVQVGAEYFNAPVPPRVPFPDIRRTRIFGRVRTGAGLRAMAFLAHPRAGRVGTTDATPASPTLTVLDSTGQHRASAVVEIPPHGCRIGEIQDLVPGAAAILGATAHGTLRVRDTGARVYGYYWVERSGAQTFPVCHLVGG